eukprot:TRINITY_DN216_c0_g1_i2.p1 TRINITY_DN216_c0_g1~~TRINITY_DN216_c0_g1_i2.p1  ORF type:complete len:495 (-),score=130.28 TRINITY_DN216_c0_g1_i2:129-1532(-)
MDFDKIEVRDLKIGSEGLVQVTSDTPVQDVCVLLKEKNILSAPVWDAHLRRYVGIIDALLILNDFEPGDFQSRPAGDVVRGWDKARVTVHGLMDSLKSVMKSLSTGVHRVLVSETGQPTSGKPAFKLISQTDIVRWLLDNEDKLSEMVRTAKVENLMPFSGRVVQMGIGESALEGFMRLRYEDVSGIAIVDLEGKLVGNLSASDLRGMTADRFEAMRLPVLDFLLSIHRQPHTMPVICTINDHLPQIMASALAAKVHRVWVVNASGMPIGVITLTDMIASVLENHVPGASLLDQKLSAFRITQPSAEEAEAGGGLRYMLCVDGSDGSQRAAAFLQRMLHPGDRLWLYMGYSPFWNFGPVYDDPKAIAARRQHAHNTVGKIWGQLRSRAGLAKGAIRAHVAEVADVREGILRFAEDQRIDIVVLGSRGLGKVKRILLGSVSTYVTENAHCSVLVVPPATERVSGSQSL